MTLQEFINTIDEEYACQFDAGRDFNLWRAIRYVNSLLDDTGITAILKEHGISLKMDNDRYSSVNACFRFSTTYRNQSQSLFAERYSGRLPIYLKACRKKRGKTMRFHHLDWEWEENPNLTMDAGEYFLSVVQKCVDKMAVQSAEDLYNALEMCEFMKEHSLTLEDVEKLSRDLDALRKSKTCMVPLGFVDGRVSVWPAVEKSFFDVPCAMAKEMSKMPALRENDVLVEGLLEKSQRLETAATIPWKVYLCKDTEAFDDLCARIPDADKVPERVKPVLSIIQRAEMDHFICGDTRFVLTDVSVFFGGCDASGLTLQLVDDHYEVKKFYHKAELRDSLQDGDIILLAMASTSSGSDGWRRCKDLGYCPILGEHSNPTTFDCDHYCPGRNEED